MRFDDKAARPMITSHRRILSGFLLALCCFVVILICSTGLVFALDPSRMLNQFGHDLWQREQGLPNNTIHAILQTHDGYLWMATEEGLVRFDGVRFKVFDAENTREIPSSQIQVLFEDRQGELWIGTAAGLTRYKDQQFSPYTAGGRLPDIARFVRNRDR